MGHLGKEKIHRPLLGQLKKSRGEGGIIRYQYPQRSGRQFGFGGLEQGGEPALISRQGKEGLVIGPVVGDPRQWVAGS